MPQRIYIHILVIQLILILFLLSGCKEDKSMFSLNQALELAGENRLELEKVLSFYGKNPKDSLKYKAACFLIENMPYYHYYEGELLDNYLTYPSLLRKNKFTAIPPTELADSIVTLYGSFSYQSLELKKDIQVVDSAFLCNNIDWAFKVWEEQPWGKNISFDDFCEYILPYRIGNEKIEYWREKYYNKYNKLLDIIRESEPEVAEDPISAVFALMEHLTDRDSIYFTTASPGTLPHFGPTIAELKSGNCRELADYVVYVCRSLGIPCHIDFYQIRGNDNVGHFWVSFYDKKKQLYSQDFPEGVGNITTNGIKRDSKAKVYRRTFSINKELGTKVLKYAKSVPALFQLPLFTDVTGIYSEHIIDKWSFPLTNLYNKERENNEIFYLCNAQYLSWDPVAMATFSENSLEFDMINKGSIMRLATWQSGQLIFWSDPFRIDPLSNKVTFYTAGDSLETVTLFSKFDVWAEDLFRRRMLGGVLEGSNDSNFNKKDTLLVINKMSGRLVNRFNTQSTKEYRYVRYYGPKDAFCNVSEIVLYEGLNDTISLKGQILGTPGSFEIHNPQEYTNAFDGYTWTSFNYKEPYGGWVGLDLVTPKKISQVTFTYRNHDNFIRPGDKFELFYCDDKWKSLGIVEAKTDSLIYENVPRGAMLYLKNHTRGNQERIFTMEENKQKFK